MGNRDEKASQSTSPQSAGRAELSAVATVSAEALATGDVLTVERNDLASSDTDRRNALEQITMPRTPSGISSHANDDNIDADADGAGPITKNTTS